MSQPPPPDRGPLSLREVRRDLLSEWLSLDRGLLHTFVEVWRAPAALAARYVQTRDPRLVRPVRYLVVAVAAYSGLAWLLLSKLGLAGHLALTPLQVAQTDFVIQNAGWVVLLVVPVIAALLRAFENPHAGSYVHALVLAAYTQAQALWVQALVLTPLALLTAPWIVLATTLLIAAWLLWAWSGYYPGRPVRAAIAATSALVLGTLVNQLVVQAALRWFGPT